MSTVNTGRKPLPPTPRVVDDRYRAWINQQPCLLCGIQKQSEAAHPHNNGTAAKCDDWKCLPLCVRCHREGRFSHHKLGPAFFDFHRIDQHGEIAKLNARYVIETGKQPKKEKQVRTPAKRKVSEAAREKRKAKRFEQQYRFLSKIVKEKKAS